MRDHHSVKMFSFVLTLALISTVWGASNGGPHVRLAGGHSTSIDKYPYNVQVNSGPVSASGYTEYIGGGALIANNFVLTSATLVHNITLENLSVRVNASHLPAVETVGTKVIQARNVTIHPYYNKNFPHNYDIAVIELSEVVKFGVGTQSVEIPKEVPRIGSTVSSTGFGTYYYGGYFYIDPLAATELTIIEDVKCVQEYSGQLVYANHICAAPIGAQDDKGPCDGDVGSPLAYEGVLHGLYTHGKCGNGGSPIVFTSVAKFKKFIDSVVGKK